MTPLNCVAKTTRKLRKLLPILCLLILPRAGEATGLSPNSADEQWILVDATTATLEVMQGDKVKARFTDIAFGKVGPRPIHLQGDDSTPLGEFRIDGINTNSMYTLFFKLNYPTAEHAKLAWEQGYITADHFRQIVAAQRAGISPPHDTPLGGMIGIHGLGQANPEVHKYFNWTEGCVALDNEQILALAGYVRVGMRVVIQSSPMAVADHR